MVPHASSTRDIFAIGMNLGASLTGLGCQGKDAAQQSPAVVTHGEEGIRWRTSLRKLSLGLL